MISDSLGDSIYSEQNIHGRYGSPYVDSVLKQTIDYAQSLLTPIERAAAGAAVPYTVDFEYEVWVIRFTMPDGSVTVSLDYVERGDVNRDGVVNIADVTTALNVLSGAEVNTHCDLNGDGVLNITDVTTLLNDLSGGSA